MEIFSTLAVTFLTEFLIENIRTARKLDDLKILRA